MGATLSIHDMTNGQLQAHIRRLAKDSSRVVFVPHALERMLQRAVSDWEVFECLRSGVIQRPPALDKNRLPAVSHGAFWGGPELGRHRGLGRRRPARDCGNGNDEDEVSVMENWLHYTACGLDNVWLANGFTIKETKYGKGVSIDDVDGLHRLLASNLVEKKGF